MKTTDDIKKPYNGGFKGEPSYDEKHYESGIVRVAVKGGYKYFHVKNKKPVTEQQLERINKLRLPPAWINVWISGDPKTDIQAVGVDAKGRKQYKYNEKYIAQAEQRKFMRLIHFVKHLPKLNEVLVEHGKLNVYNKNRVISTMLKMVQELHLRVGKEQYAKQNQSYGISSLKKTHIHITGDTIKLHFMGKSKQLHDYTLQDKDIAHHLKMLLKLSGEKLFQCVDETNNIKHVDDGDINNYIQTYMGNEFTIKDFRTYAANYYFIKTLLEETKRNGNNAKKNIINAIKVSAEHLGHTKNVSKKAYIMSFTINMYLDHPEFFVTRKYSDPNKVLMDILTMYKKSLMK